MKKNSIFKFLVILMAIITLLTWFIPTGYFSSEYVDSGIIRLGFFDYCQYLILPFFQSMFIEVLVFLLAVGAFYGVLSNTGAYRAILEKIANKFKKKGTLFLIITAFLIAALSSFGGYGLLLFIFIPAIISIILLMGYDKLTAFMTTFVSMLIGVIGTTFGASYVSQTLSVLALDYKSQIWFKVILFILSFVIFILFTIKHAKKVKAKKSISKKEMDIEDIFLGKESAPKKKSCPIYIIFIALFVLLILGATQWNVVFGIDIFETIHTSITTFAIKDFTIFGYILGGSITALGSWNYFQYTILLVIASLIIGISYKLKFKDSIENMINGLKKLVVPSLLVTFAYAILILIANTGIFTTLMSYLLAGAEKFNLFIASIISIVGSALHIEMPYIGNFYLPYLASVYTSEYAAALLNVMSQALYGLTMFIAPTSLFMILGLTYLNIPYKKWLKFSWKLVLEIFILIIVVLITMLLILK